MAAIENPRIQALPFTKAGDPVHLASIISSLTLFNKDSTAVASNPTRFDKQLDGTDTNAANVVTVNVPIGGAFLDLIHQFTGTAPVTLPEVLVFLLLPDPPNSAQGYPVNGPAQGQSTITNQPSGGEWVLAGALSTSDYSPAIGDTTSDPLWEDGTSKRSTPRIINVRGAIRVMVVIKTAATDVTKGVIVGYFSK